MPDPGDLVAPLGTRKDNQDHDFHECECVDCLLDRLQELGRKLGDPPYDIDPNVEPDDDE